MNKVFTILTLIGVATGCHRQKPENLLSPVHATQTAELSEQGAIELARAAVKANDDWANRATFDPKKNADGTWSVIAWRIEGYDKEGKPQYVPGGHRLIMIDRQGRIMSYSIGR